MKTTKFKKLGSRLKKFFKNFYKELEEWGAAAGYAIRR